jgi:aspartate/glutamate racemase
LKRRVTFIHTSPAAIGPLSQFYSEAAPDYEVTNLLDDGIMRLFSTKDYSLIEKRFMDMASVARDLYGTQLIMLTCSAVPDSVMNQLKDGAGIPLFKIDEPLATTAVQAGSKEFSRIGVVISFAPTIEPTSNLLNDTANRLKKRIELSIQVIPEAYKALLLGDMEAHDNYLIEAVKELDKDGVDTIVLAQVSMARIIKQLNGEIKRPVLSSLHTSLIKIRELLGDN